MRPTTNAWPQVTLVIAPCRSFSTAFIRATGLGGTLSVYQPEKARLRWASQGVSTEPFMIPRHLDKIVVKETIGPYTDEESRFNPLQAYLDMGVPEENLQILFIERDPLSMIPSWLAEFYERADPNTLIENAITAYKTLDEVRGQAENLGIRTHTLVYEALRDRDPRDVLTPLFTKLNLPLSEDVYKDWTTLPPIGEEGSNVILPPEPPEIAAINRKLHEKLNRSHGLTFYERPTNDIRTRLRGHLSRITNSGIRAIYLKDRDRCIAELGIPMPPNPEGSVLIQRDREPTTLPPRARL